MLDVALYLGAGLVAGVFGSLTGLGGGVILTPVLVLALGMDMRYAVPAALVAVVATSCGGASKFVKQGLVNVTLASFLEVATVVGAMLGALLAGFTPSPIVALAFGGVMLFTAWDAARRRAEPIGPADSPPASRTIADTLALHGVRAGSTPAYRVHHAGAGFVVMLAAGVLSALVGVGGGVFKVIALDRLMRVPFRAGTATSNFMIGVTAAAGAGVYLHRGQIEPTIAGPVALGALAGSTIGATLAPRLKTVTLRRVFAVVVALAAVQMVLKGIAGMQSAGGGE